MARDPAAEKYPVVVDDQHGVEVARFTARDFSNPSLLEDTFQALVSGLGHHKLVVDLSEIENTMSLGVAVLVAAQGLALIHKTRLAFAGVNPAVAKLLTLTGADKVLTTFETVEAAVESMRV